jgi:hypothetical protein
MSTDICRTKNCTESVVGIGLCNRHYDRANKLKIFGPLARKMTPDELLTALGPFDQAHGEGTKHSPEKQALLEQLRTKYPTSADDKRTGPKPKEVSAPIAFPTPEQVTMRVPASSKGEIGDVLGLPKKEAKPTLDQEVAGANIALTNQLRDVRKELVAAQEKIVAQAEANGRLQTNNMNWAKQVKKLEAQLETPNTDHVKTIASLQAQVHERGVRIEQHANMILALEAVGKTNVKTIAGLEARIEEMQMDAMTRPEGTLVVYRVELDIKGDPRILLTGSGNEVRKVAGLIGKKVRISE